MTQFRRINISGLAEVTHTAQQNPEMEWVKITDLVIDDTYQRSLETRGRKNIEAIATAFSWGRFTPLLVAPLAGGKFAVIDGQHRTHAAALCGYKSVPAMIVEMSQREQALAFSWVNGNVTNVTPFQVFRAALVAGEEWAVKSDGAVRKAGCKLMTTNASTANKEPGEVYCVGAVKRHVGEGSAKYVTAALLSLRACNDAAMPVMYSATVLRPWISCLIEARLTNHALLVEFLDNNSFKKLLAGVDRMRDRQRNEGGPDGMFTTIVAPQEEVSMSASFLHGVEVIEIDAGPRPIQTVKSSVIGIVGTAPDADDTAFPLNTPVLVAGSRTEAALLDTVGDLKGTLPTAMDGVFDQAGAVVVVVRVEEGADETETLANVIGGVNAVDGNFEGVHALAGAESVIGFAPRILIAPGFTHQRPSELANPVVAELQGIADRIHAMVIMDGPNTTDTAAFTAAGDFGSSRIYLVDPWHKVMVGETITDVPPSSRAAGLIAKTDNETGFWASPSNHLISGIIGTSRPVDFKLGDENARANLLNEQKVATTIRQNGYRLWGNRTLTADAKWVFLSVRRTADIINDSLLRAHLWAVDRGITRTYVEDVEESVNAYLRDLTAMGAILGGRCWADPDLNSAANVALGKVFFNFDFTPVYPAEHITFRSHLVNDYIEEVFN